MAFNSKSVSDPPKSSPYNHLNKLCDTIIEASDGTEFKAHKLILAIRSEYFRAYFRSNFEKKDTLKLPFDKDLLENILQFIYTDVCCLNAHNIACVTMAADYLLIDDLITRCKDFALRKISVESCISLFLTSKIVKKLEITNHCYRYLQINFGSIVNENSGIEELQFSTLKSLLYDDSLGVADEETIWKAIVIWVNRDNGERLKHVPELLTCIRWNSASYNLVLRIQNHSIVRECESTISKRETVQYAIQHHSPERYPKKMHILICRSPYGDKSDLYLTYDGKYDMWRKIGETDGHFEALFTKGRFMYMINPWPPNMKTFDLLQKVWVERGHISASRYDYRVVQSEDRLFVIGGNDSSTDFVSTEFACYDLMDDRWHYLQPVPFMKVGGAAIISGKLYAVGHRRNDEEVEMRALEYDLNLEYWSDIAIPRAVGKIDIKFGMINFRDQIYIFDKFTSVETYNISQNEWNDFPSLPFRYQSPYGIIFNDRLIIYDKTLDQYLFDRQRFSPCVWNDEVCTWDVVHVASPYHDIHRYIICCIDDLDILKELSTENRASATLLTKTPFEMLNDTSKNS